MSATGSKRLSLMFILFAALLFCGKSAEAKIEFIKVDPASDQLFFGTVLYTSPDGIPDVLVPEGTVPDIETGSSLEVFDGVFKVETGASDTVTLTCGGTTFQAAGNTSATVSCSQTKGGKIVVHKGSVRILGLSEEAMARMQWDGILYAGQSYSIRQGLTSVAEDVVDPDALVKELLEGKNAPILDPPVVDPALIARLESLPTGDVFKSSALFSETQQLTQIPDSTNIEQI